jgi:hypothetical protein
VERTEAVAAGASEAWARGSRLGQDTRLSFVWAWRLARGGGACEARGAGKNGCSRFFWAAPAGVDHVEGVAHNVELDAGVCGWCGYEIISVLEIGRRGPLL